MTNKEPAQPRDPEILIRRVVNLWNSGLNTYEIAAELRGLSVTEPRADDIVFDYLVAKRKNA